MTDLSTQDTFERDPFADFERLRTRWSATLLWRKGDGVSMQKALVDVHEAVYLQLRRDGRCYVGEALEVKRRQRRHLDNGVSVEALAVINMPGAGKKELQARETEVVCDAVNLGIPLANVDKLDHASKVNAGLSWRAMAGRDFATADMTDAIAAFWSDAGMLNSVCRILRKMTDEEHDEARRDRETAGFFEAVHLVNLYILRVIPKASETVKRRWCIVRGSRAPGAPWFTVRAGKTDLLVVSRRVKSKGDFAVDVIMRLASAPVEMAWQSAEKAQVVFGGEWKREVTKPAGAVFPKKDAMGVLTAEDRREAMAALSSFCACAGDTLLVSGTSDLAEDLLSFEETLLAAQIQCARDMKMALETARFPEGIPWPWL